METYLETVDAWAAVWWVWMVQSSWQVAVVALVVWGLSRVTRNHAASFRCALWLLVFVKLLVPPNLTAPWSLGVVADQVASVGGYEAPAYEGAPLAEDYVARSSGNHAPLEQGPGLLAADVGAFTAPLNVLACGLWLTVCVGMLSGMYFQYRRFYRKSIQGTEDAPAWLAKLVAGQSKAIGLGRVPAVRVIRKGGVPAVFGLWHPVVLLPQSWLARFEESDLEGVITHELAHIKRGDLAVAWVTSCLACCYWFHPLVWLAHGHLRREREMACDDWVLRTKTTDGTDYAGTILKGAEYAGDMVPAGAGFLGLIEVSENLLYRIRSAGDVDRRREMGFRSVAALCLLAVGLFPIGSVTRAEGQAIPADRKTELARYEKAQPEVQAFIKHTCESFGRSGLWLDVGAMENLSEADREKKITYIDGVLTGEYGRHQCESLAEAGVLVDSRLLPGLMKVAAYQRDDQDYDCRAKWMAVAALGRQGDEGAIPVLIPLVDHGNQNTRLWARASLVRLTGETFQDDKKAWGAWWNAQDKGAKLSEADLAPWVMPGTQEKADEKVEASVAVAPEIVSITPAIGASEVDPALGVITVTFDQDMGSGFSWTGGGDLFPETAGKPRWTNKRTCELPVKLQPAKVYRLGINSTSFGNFRGTNGVPARNRVLYFATKGADPAALSALTPPTVVSKSITKVGDGIQVSFDKPMGDGGSWTRTGGNFPEITGKMTWSEDKLTCTLPVKLVKGTTYHVGINSAQHLNFQSASGGVPVAPEVWEFRAE